MKRLSNSSRAAALLAVVVLAFAQLAMAAFAPPAATPRMVEAMAQGMPCHQPRADPGAAHLCIKKNCHDDAQKHEAPTLDPAALPLQLGLRVDVPREPASPARDVPESLLARAASPPPLLAFARRLE